MKDSQGILGVVNCNKSKTTSEKVAVHAQKNPRIAAQDEVFKVRLEAIIDGGHELVKLAAVIEWEGLEGEFSGFYCADNARPGGAIRLRAGLCFLKDMKGLSDEELCAVWCETPYFQHFCGETFFQHGFPVEPPSLSIFRARIGSEGLPETHAAAFFYRHHCKTRY